MKVVALVSGGKDSCYAMMRCIDYGHEIVALANLMPLDESIDELDSYMYQTVGHQIVVSYAECMGLPLFRRRIQGSTRHKHLSYEMTSGDEVEDMFILLKEVKQKMPSITAVSSGAIASDYQRLRVENICSRLGFVSLAYLWKQDQTLLLEEMVERGINAIIIKVAALGLNPAKHLGREIADMQNQLLQLKERYGINVCGEGGEYETLTLDCPLFTNARIVLDDFQVLLHSVDSIAPVGVLHPSSFHLERKEIPHDDNASEKYSINLEATGSVHEVQGDTLPNQVPNCQTGDLALKTCTSMEKTLHISATKRSTFSISSWKLSSSSEDLQEDLTSILRKIEVQLGEDGVGWANVLYIHLYISNINDFSLANEVYLRFITEKKCYLGVPSRSTIELPLVQAGLGNACVEVLVTNDCHKKVLHVQSISCWAPSCIGPYSQATLHKGILYMAGQLGLDPPTMMLCSGGPTVELERALENCEAVITSFNSSIASAIILVIYCSETLTSSERFDIQCVTEKFLSEKASSLQISCLSEAPSPISLYILASALPKRALVEVKPILYVPEQMEDIIPTFLPTGTCLKMPCMWDFGCFQFCDSCCQKFIVPGKICTAVASITNDMAAELCSLSYKNPTCYKSEKHVKRISAFCIFVLHMTLLENKFSWADLMSLRIYFPTSIAANSLSNAFSDTFAELAEIDNAIMTYKEPIFSLIPVVSAGRSATMGDLITCELFVSKL